MLLSISPNLTIQTTIFDRKGLIAISNYYSMLPITSTESQEIFDNRVQQEDGRWTMEDAMEDAMDDGQWTIGRRTMEDGR